MPNAAPMTGRQATSRVKELREHVDLLLAACEWSGVLSDS